MGEHVRPYSVCNGFCDLILILVHLLWSPFICLINCKLSLRCILRFINYIQTILISKTSIYSALLLTNTDVLDSYLLKSFPLRRNRFPLISNICTVYIPKIYNLTCILEHLAERIRRVFVVLVIGIEIVHVKVCGWIIVIIISTATKIASFKPIPLYKTCFFLNYKNLHD